MGARVVNPANWTRHLSTRTVFMAEGSAISADVSSAYGVDHARAARSVFMLGGSVLAAFRLFSMKPAPKTRSAAN